MIFIEVTAAPEPPDAHDDFATTPFETPVTVDVLVNDQGEDLTIVGVVQPLHGACRVTEDGRIRYEPAAGHSGPDICPYRACDAAHACDAANVFFEVGPGPPAARDDRAETAPLTPVTVDVAANDVHPMDVPLEVIDVASPAERGVCEVVDGQVRYTPDPDFYAGTDRCRYTTCVEDTAQCDEGTLTVEVVAEPPLARDDKEVTPANASVTVVSSVFVRIPCIGTFCRPRLTRHLFFGAVRVAKRRESASCVVTGGCQRDAAGERSVRIFLRRLRPLHSRTVLRRHRPVPLPRLP